MRVAIYVRISLDKLGDEHGIENQLAKCREYAAHHGWIIAGIFTDNDISATNGKPRPRYLDLMAAAARGEFDAIIVWQTSRFWRNRRERADGIEVLRQAQISLLAVKGPSLDMSTAYGRMMCGLLGEFDTMETEVKGERQRLANEQAALKGQRRTACPRSFGYADDHVTPDPVEKAAVVSACRTLLGGGTISGVAREWAKLDIRPPQAPYGPLPRNAWNRGSIREILLNPGIAGLLVYRGEVISKGDWTPLVPEETWRAVAAILQDPARKPPRGVRTLLGGITTCPCGNSTASSVSHLGQHVYRCNPQTRNGRPGPHVARQAAPVDAWVTGAVLERLSRPDAAGLLTAPKVRADVTALREEAAAIRQRMNDLAGDVVDGVITRAQLHAASTRATMRLSAIEAELADTGREDVLAPLVAAEDLGATWEALDLSRKRAVIAALWDVVLHPTGRGSRGFDPNTIELCPTGKSE
jgi:DNA invertase Pin-like site-specific DNA recombinase